RGRAVGEHGKLAGRVVEAGELQPRIERGAIRRLHLERVLVAGLEALADERAARLVLDDDEAPRLGEADRRREAGDADQPLDGAGGKRRALEAPHVAPPAQEIVKTLAKLVVELRR